MMHGPRPFGIDEGALQWAEDSAYSTFSFTTNPLAIARSRTKDIYRWRVMPDFAARASRRFTSFAVRRTVTGLAVSRVGGMACEHVREEKNTLTHLLCNKFLIAGAI